MYIYLENPGTLAHWVSTLPPVCLLTDLPKLVQCLPIPAEEPLGPEPSMEAAITEVMEDIGQSGLPFGSGSSCRPPLSWLTPWGAVSLMAGELYPADPRGGVLRGPEIPAASAGTRHLTRAGATFLSS